MGKRQMFVLRREEGSFVCGVLMESFEKIEMPPFPVVVKLPRFLQVSVQMSPRQRGLPWQPSSEIVLPLSLSFRLALASDGDLSPSCIFTYLLVYYPIGKNW